MPNKERKCKSETSISSTHRHDVLFYVFCLSLSEFGSPFFIFFGRKKKGANLLLLVSIVAQLDGGGVKSPDDARDIKQRQSSVYYVRSRRER